MNRSLFLPIFELANPRDRIIYLSINLICFHSSFLRFFYLCIHSFSLWVVFNADYFTLGHGCLCFQLVCVCCYEEFLNDMETMQYSRKLATSQMFHSVFLKGVIIMFSLEKSISGETSKKLTLKFYTCIHTCIYLSSYMCVCVYIYENFTTKSSSTKP